MTLLQVNTSLFKWLQSINLVMYANKTSESIMTLSQETSDKFFDGSYICQILRKILSSQNENDQLHSIKLNSIKDESSPAIRLHNWNILSDVLKHFGYILESTNKNNILNLQAEPILTILLFLRSFFMDQMKTQMPDRSGKRGSQSYSQELTKPKHQSEISTQKKNSILSIPNTQNAQQKSLNEATNVMEFFAISLSNALNLPTHQVLNLFDNSNKKLHEILLNGKQGFFEPILQFQDNILNNLEFLILKLFAINERQSISLFTNCIKSCLMSNSLQVLEKGMQILERISNISDENETSINDFMITWMQDEGVNLLLSNVKRFQSTLQKSVAVSHKYLGKDTFNYMQPLEKSPLWASQYQKLHFYFLFLVVASDDVLKLFRQESVCLTLWNLHCWKLMKKNKSSIPQMNLLIKIGFNSWLSFSQEYQADERNLPDVFLSFAKGTSFLNNSILFCESIKAMFDMMEILGKRKNKFAPTFYKALINCLSFETIQDRIIFMVDNFISAFSRIESLPGSCFIEFLLKSIQKKCTIPSLNLCKMLIQTNKISQDQSIQAIEIMTNIFFQDVILLFNFIQICYGQTAIIYCFQCLNYISEEIKQEFLIKNSQFCLAHFYSIAKSINKSFQELQLNLHKCEVETTKIWNTSHILMQAKRYILLQNLSTFLMQVLTKQNSQIKQQLKDSIFLTYVRIKHELKKPKISEILLNLMRLYYEFQEDLESKIMLYEYQNYSHFEQNRKQEETQELYNQQISIDSSMYESKSFIMGESYVSKNINKSILKPENSALKDIIQIKNKREKLRIQSEQNERNNEIILQKKQRKINILKQKRKIKYGGPKSEHDLEYKCLLEFDSVKPEIRMTGWPQIDLIDLNQEQQDVYVTDVNSILKNYKKLWRYLFLKFSTFGTRHKSSINNQVQEKINIAEIWKLHREYEVDFLKKQQCFAIVRKINEKMKRRNDLQNLTYQGFQEYILQFSYYDCSRVGLAGLSPGQMVKRFIKDLRSTTAQNGGNLEIFQNPNEVYFQQSEVVKQFNRRLQRSPDYILPEGYKKLKTFKSVYHYQIAEINKEACKQSQHTNSYSQVLAILDEIFAETKSLGFHILQPDIKSQEKAYAKPILFQQLNQKMKGYRGGYMLPKKPINTSKLAQLQKVHPVKSQFHPLVNFSLGIKIGLASVPIKFKYIGQQVAYWMDDMLDAVQRGSSKVIDKAKIKIQNQAVRNRKNMNERIKTEFKSKEKLFKIRSQSVRIEFQKIQDIKFVSRKQRMQKQKLKKLQQKEAQQKSAKIKYKQFQKAKQYFSQKHQKQKQHALEIESLKKKERQQNKKGTGQYLKKKKLELQQKQMMIKQNREAQRNKQIEEKLKQKKKQKKVFLSVLKKDEQTMNRIQCFKEKYEKFISSQFVHQEMQLHRKSMQLLFDLLLKYQNSKISTTYKHQINANTFNFFAIKFKISPFLLQKNNVIKVFRSVGKDLFNRSNADLPQKGFELVLLKIIVKAKDKLNQLVQKKRKGNSSTKLRHKSLMVGEEENQQQQNTDFQRSKVVLKNSNLSRISRLLVNQNLTDQYLFDPDGVTRQTIRQFMIFMNLPNDKLTMDIRFREAVQSNNSKPSKILKRQQSQRF